MKYFEYKFQCTKLATKHTLHSVVSYFFGKDKLNEVNYKVYKEGRLITVISDSNINKDFSIELFNKKGKAFNCTLVKKIERETSNFKKGDSFLLSGTIEYGVNKTNSKGKKCPIFLGRFESKELQSLFKQNIERQFGVKVPNMKNIFFNRLPSEILENHIQFNNLINISIPVVVEDESVFEKIEFSSYFQKKSYGFGNIEVLKYVADKKEEENEQETI